MCPPLINASNTFLATSVLLIFILPFTSDITLKIIFPITILSQLIVFCNVSTCQELVINKTPCTFLYFICVISVFLFLPCVSESMLLNTLTPLYLDNIPATSCQTSTPSSTPLHEYRTIFSLRCQLLLIHQYKINIPLAKPWAHITHSCGLIWGKFLTASTRMLIVNNQISIFIFVKTW